MVGWVGGIRVAVRGGIVVRPRLLQAGRVGVGVGEGVRVMAGRAPEGVDGGQGRGQRPEILRGGGAENAVVGRGVGVGEGERVVRGGEGQRRTVRAEGLRGRARGLRRRRRRVQRGAEDGGDGRPGRQGKRVEEGRRGERRLVGVVRVRAAGEGVCGAGEVGGVGEVAAGAH